MSVPLSSRVAELWKNDLIILTPLILAWLGGRNTSVRMQDAWELHWEKIVPAKGLGNASAALGNKTAPGKQYLLEIRDLDAVASCCCANIHADRDHFWGSSLCWELSTVSLQVTARAGMLQVVQLHANWM